MARGKFKSERQRRFMFASVPKAAHKWAHGMATNKSDWAGAHKPSAKRHLKQRRRG
jgi:hypothetical protein